MTCCNQECNQGRDCPLRSSELPEVTSPFAQMTDFLWAVATILAAGVVATDFGTLLIWSFT